MSNVAKRQAPNGSKALVTAVAAKNLDALRRLLPAGKMSAIPAAAMMKAGQMAWLPGLKLLIARGGDLNASYKNYRALHALIQEEPHGVTASTSARVRCLEWMLAHGADPDLPGAWPSARALVIAAFQGERAYVDVLRKHAGGRLDIFAAAALGDATRVGKLLAADPSLALARDHERRARDRIHRQQCAPARTRVAS